MNESSDIATVAVESVERHYEQYSNVFSNIGNWFCRDGVNILLNAVAAAIVILIGWFIAKALHRAAERFFSQRELSGKLRVRMLVGVSIAAWWVAVALVVFGCFGVNVLPALAGLGVAGIVVGFAFQESLSSLAAGLMMSFSDPFDVGDEVTISGLQGVVKRFGYTATVIRTYDARFVTIPNKQVWGSVIVNHTRDNIRRVDRTVSVAYGCDVEVACKVVEEALLAMPQVLRDPAPRVWCTELADSACTLTAWPWVKTTDYWSFWETSYPVIKKALEKAGISIPFPQMDVHLDKPAC